MTYLDCLILPDPHQIYFQQLFLHQLGALFQDYRNYIPRDLLHRNHDLHCLQFDYLSNHETFEES